MSNHAQSEAGKRRVRRVDVLRGLAILLVFLLHWFGNAFGTDHFEWNGLVRDLHSAPSTAFYFFFPLSYGWMGVPLFFVISGFSIHLSEMRRQEFSGARFFWLRFWRIYPPYLAAVIFFAWWTGAMHAPDARAQLWSHLLLIHNFKLNLFGGINPVLWSLAVEAQLYLLYPLLRMLRSRFGMHGALLATFALSLISRAIAVPSIDWLADLPGNVWTFPTMLWFDWALGAYVAECYLQNRRAFRASSVLVVAMFLAVFASTFFKPAMIFSFSLASCSFALWMDAYLTGERTLTWIERTAVAIGLCSYSLYLIHYPLIHPLWEMIARALPLSAPALLVAAFPIVFGIVFLLARVCYQLVERTSIAVGHAILPPVEKKRGAPLDVPRS